MFKQFFILILICLSSILALAQTRTQDAAEPLKLSSKPQAIYTNKARKKNVEGTVRLRVTFLRSGEIGAVTYISETSKKMKLTKYGLVEQAIEAAKQIKFEPAKRNGQPISVTKIVEYTFTLY